MTTATVDHKALLASYADTISDFVNGRKNKEPTDGLGISDHGLVWEDDVVLARMGADQDSVFVLDHGYETFGNRVKNALREAGYELYDQGVLTSWWRKDEG